MNSLIKFIAYLFLLAIFAVLASVGGAYYWMNSELTMPAQYVDVIVPAGTKPAAIARLINQAGIPLETNSFAWLARLTGQDKKIKAGGYQVRVGDTPSTVLRRMAQGDVTSRQVTLVEGWTVKQILNALSQQADLSHKLNANAKDTSSLAQEIGIAKPYAEGLFFPDTYVYFIGTSDKELLTRALVAQQQILNKAWDEREPDLPLQNPYEALILASIVEKETASPSDRARIAGVFMNRLKAGMPLQTDPTVIYGLRENYDGKLRKRDLQTDTLWNTYTRSGLPPSPIASVGRAALNATLHPEQHDYLYFVSKGDGTSVFASNLPDHNKNVATYILGKKQ